ncbi:CynX/NimT family MFS transporter [Geomicrobium sediminis]|uniref:CP family cyanate transporter-like MFS transporter n=1 Tax=Geomicrobium sediminis TaxID=1347788 RepID=A0ABS2PEW0_9BACL|nr:MFS transporter [Geomicrobium sediminis]MBM7633358.1 CP family cyanate transporter-like MFS transporter [Geomicrobium sediminis]
MLNTTPTKRAPYVLAVIAILFVALNLRPAITSVGPLLMMIRDDLHLSHVQISFMTALPLLSFSLLSLFAPKLSRTFGLERTIFVGLILLILGIIVRFMPVNVLLFVGTALVGIGIALCNVLIPGFVKKTFPLRVGLFTSLYMTSMAVFATIASGVSVPLALNLGLGWNVSLFIWIVPAFLALILWLPQLQYKTKNQIKTVPTATKLWHSKLAWQVTAFMGLQSILFYSLITWLPELLMLNGFNATEAGFFLAWMQIFGIPATFIVPIIGARLYDQRKIVLTLGVLYATGFLGLIFFNSSLFATGLFIAFVGIAQGGAVSLSFLLLSLRTQTAQDAASLSGMSQAAGYLFATIGPIGFGLLLQSIQLPELTYMLFLILTIALLLVGLFASRNKLI